MVDELVLLEGDDMTHSDVISIPIRVSPTVEWSLVQCAIMIVSRQTYTLFTLKGSCLHV